MLRAKPRRTQSLHADHPMALTSQVETELEALTSLRVLVAVAKADGTLHPEERAALEAALGRVRLPAGTTLELLLEERNDFAGLLGQIRSSDVREKLYQSAYAMAHADGKLHPDEDRLIRQLQTAFAIAPEKQSLTSRLFAETKDTVLYTHIAPISDPVRRAAEIREDVTKYSIISAVLGAFPVPGLAIATDLAVVGVQVKLIRDIGQYYGHALDAESAKTLLTGLGLGTGVRIAVSNIAKLVPVWGSAFGATTSFVSTWALGKIAVKYFDSGMRANLSELKADMKAAEQEAKGAYSANKSAIAAKEAQHKAQLEAWGADLKAGKLSAAEYEARVTSLR
jgi:uncharacterized protein (DUF697 family)/tellurite resistance protein